VKMSNTVANWLSGVSIFVALATAGWRTSQSGSVRANPPWAYKAGEFLRAYRANRDGVHVRVLEVERLAEVLLDYLDGSRGYWKGTATTLFDDLIVLARSEGVTAKLPESPSALSSWLKRLEPTLMHFGVHLQFYREKHEGTRIVELRRKGVSVVSSVSAEDQEGRVTTD
jgi:hypothetical protein